eukprot:281878-Rhodomonas_salina.3
MKRGLDISWFAEQYKRQCFPLGPSSAVNTLNVDCCMDVVPDQPAMPKMMMASTNQACSDEYMHDPPADTGHSTDDDEAGEHFRAHQDWYSNQPGCYYESGSLFASAGCA